MTSWNYKPINPYKLFNDISKRQQQIISFSYPKFHVTQESMKPVNTNKLLAEALSESQFTKKMIQTPSMLGKQIFAEYEPKQKELRSTIFSFFNTKMPKIPNVSWTLDQNQEIQKFLNSFNDTIKKFSQDPTASLRQALAEQEQRQKEFRENITSLLSMKMTDIANYSLDFDIEFPYEEVKENKLKNASKGISNWFYELCLNTYFYFAVKSFVELLASIKNIFSTFQFLKSIIDWCINFLKSGPPF